MEKLSFFVSQNPEQSLELTFCTELPEFIHMVKIYPEAGIELFFDAEVAWTSSLEEEAEHLLQANLLYA